MNLYVNYYSADFLTEVDLDTLIRVRALDLTPGGGGDYAEDVIIIGDYLFLGRNPAVPGSQIVRIALPTFAEVDRLAIPYIDNGGPHKAFAADDTYLYSVADNVGGVNGRIYRIVLATFTILDFLDLTIRHPWAQNSTKDGNTLYVPHDRLNASVTRIDLATFTNTGNVAITERYPVCGVIEGNFLYLGHSSNPARITKFNLTTFAEDSVITFPPGEGWCWSIVSDGTYLYCGLASAPGTPGIVVRVAIATFTRVDSLVLPLAEPDVWNEYIYNNKLYLLLESSPTAVVRVDMPTFTREAAIVFPAAEFDSWSGGLWAPAPLATVPINKAYALAREEL